MIRPGRGVSSVNGSTHFLDGKYYHFYDRLLTKDAPELYMDLLESAQSSIVVWDPHYSQCKPEIFSVVQNNGIHIEVLTVCENWESKNDMYAFADKIRNAVDSAAVPECHVYVNALSHRDLRLCHWTEWHDRYLIIDNTKVFLVGSSLDAHYETRKSYGIYELTETEDINLVIDAYNAYKGSIIDISGGARGNGYICYVHRP